MSTTHEAVTLRRPRASDGYEIHQLIASSPPLDLNSIYSYYLLSDHFRESCVVAECQGRVVGFLSAYRMPHQPETLFVWQVVVSQALRGQQVAWRMLDSLLQRFERGALRQVEATVNPSNLASRSLFERLAREQGTTISEQTFLEAAAFGPGGGHEPEILLRIPLTTANS